MPTLAELAQMSDGGDSGAYVGYPQLQRQANRMKLAQIGRIPENLPDPRTYGFMSGLMGTSPDQLGMSVLSPNTAPAKDAAYYGYQLSNLGQMAPAMMPAAKAGLRTAGNAVNDAMVYGTGPLARMTPQPMRIVPPEAAKRIDMPTTMPNSKEFMEAVGNDPSAQLTNEGLLINLKRSQNTAQSGLESVRTGVFYLPENQSANLKHYRGKTNYGGSEPIEGQTLLKNPLFVKGATGGKAPEMAYEQLTDKKQLKELQDDVFKAISGPRDIKVDLVQQFLDKHAPDLVDYADYIIDNSKQGNQLRYALQEAAVAHKVRNAGHDAVLGYSKGKGDKGHFFSEVFDVRESRYPTPQGDYELMPQFESKIK
jgi:hypothetical protein